MDCLEAVLLRKARLRQDMVMPMPAAGGGHYQHQRSVLPPSYCTEEEAPCAAVDRSDLLWEDFSVDDLLDLGSGKEQNGGGEGEGFLSAEGAEEGGEERGGWGSSNSSSSSSALTFQAVPSSSDPIVPAGDVEDLEWVSRFVDDSCSEFAAAAAAAAPPFVTHHPLAVSPPAPVAAAKTEAPRPKSTSLSNPLKRSWRSSCFSAESVLVPAKARSKRLHTGGRVWSLRRPPLLSEPSSCSSCSSASSSSSYYTGFSSVTSCPFFGGHSGGGGNPDGFLHCLNGGPPLEQHWPPQLQVKKKKGRKPKVPAAAGGRGGGAEQQARRRCSHCGVDKTPQWRAGPMGAKTLCNACGVRFKSGRLLPEYRPAGSPTFLSHVHSNSHRKVLEIRRSKVLLDGDNPASASCSSPPPQLAVAIRPYGVV